MKPALRPRLSAAAELVLPGRPVLDVGTDHGLLPAALVASGRAPSAVASDIGKEPLAGAAATIARHGVGERVALRCADGLRAISPGEAATIVIAGMGARRIARILAESPAQRDAAARLVLAPNEDAPVLRGWLARHGYALVDERLALDRGRYFVVLAAERGEAAPSELELLVGPWLLRRGGPVFRQWLRRELALAERARAGLSRTAGREAELHAVAARCELLAAALAISSGPGHPESSS
jgi:tRNA (adenine22-N1)-methyltransferase